MAIATPEWLTRRGGELRRGIDGSSWVVCFDGEPQYRLTVVPVSGKHGCKIVQTINDRLIPSTGTYPTATEAILGGLDDLRKILGW